MMSSAHAANICDYYKREMPWLYSVVCKNGSASTKPAGSSSTFSSAFNISSAALPTEPSSYGLETITSYLRKPHGAWGPTFSLIKGFQKFGAGLSTSGQNIFFANDIIARHRGTSNAQSFSPYEEPKGGFTNLNIGTSFSLWNPKNGPSLKVGTSLRYNNTTSTFGGGPALIFGWTNFTIGGGFSREKISNNLPWITFTSFMTSTRIWILEFEYTNLQNHGGYDLTPIHILTVSATISRLTLTGAVRHLSFTSQGEINQQHYAIQYMISKHMSAGFLFNYIPGASSIATQFFL